jgi:hypothetical protein
MTGRPSGDPIRATQVNGLEWPSTIPAGLVSVGSTMIPSLGLSQLHPRLLCTYIWNDTSNCCSAPNPLRIYISPAREFDTMIYISNLPLGTSVRATEPPPIHTGSQYLL